MRQWSAAIAAEAALVSACLQEMAATKRDAEARAATKIRVHGLLQTTSEPFLTFAEVERALTTEAAEARSGAPDPGSSGPSKPVGGDTLRRVLIELVSDGVIAQLDRDRYFIASDYETGDGDPDRET